jgi:hypothetical protein
MENKDKRWVITTMGINWKKEEIYTNYDQRYTLGMEVVSKTPCFWFPVWNGMAQYAEYYWLEDDEYEVFLHDQDAATAFVNRCKRREMDDRLMFKPGSVRGRA